MPAALASKEEVIDRLARAFTCNGYDGASLAQLSEATGLGKSSLYHYFPGGKDDMAAAVLERVTATIVTRIVQPLRGAEPAEWRISEMLDTVDALYAGGSDPCLLGMFTQDSVVARLGPQLGDAFRSWIEALTGAFTDAGLTAADAGEAAEEAVSRIQGALILARATSDTAPFRRCLAALRRDLARQRW